MRDIFFKKYEEDFAKRVLNKRSLSNDQERFYIEQLKLEYGVTCLLKVEGMYTDINLAKGLQDKFNENHAGILDKKTTLLLKDPDLTDEQLAE